MSNGPLIFPPSGSPYRVGGLADVKVGDIYLHSSRLYPQEALAPPVQGKRGWSIQCRPRLPVGLVEGPRGTVRFWFVKAPAQLLTDSGVMTMTPIAKGLELVRGTFGHSIIENNEDIRVSPNFRLATRAGAMLRSRELADDFLAATISVFRGRYKIPNIEDYLALEERGLHPTATSLLELLESSEAAEMAIARVQKKGG